MVHEVLPVTTTISATVDIVSVEFAAIEAAPRIFRLLPHCCRNSAYPRGISRMVLLQPGLD